MRETVEAKGEKECEMKSKPGLEDGDEGGGRAGGEGEEVRNESRPGW